MAAAEKSSLKPPPRSPWPWILLALWLLWLLAMIYMSRHEWGRPRPAHTPNTVDSSR